MHNNANCYILECKNPNCNILYLFYFTYISGIKKKKTIFKIPTHIYKILIY